MMRMKEQPFHIHIEQWQGMFSVGLLEHERQGKQQLLFDLALEYSPLGLVNERLGQTIDYRMLLNMLAKLEAQERHWDLLESLAETLAEQIEQQQPALQAVSVRISKPQLMQGKARLSIERTYRA